MGLDTGGDKRCQVNKKGESSSSPVIHGINELAVLPDKHSTEIVIFGLSTLEIPRATEAIALSMHGKVQNLVLVDRFRWTFFVRHYDFRLGPASVHWERIRPVSIHANGVEAVIFPCRSQV